MSFDNLLSLLSPLLVFTVRSERTTVSPVSPRRHGLQFPAALGHVIVRHRIWPRRL
jgi:hypothetical protein